MSELVLPSGLNYSPQQTLPAGTTSYIATTVPQNGSTFTQNQTIYVDLPTSDSFLDPKSLTLSYQVSFTTGAAATTANGIIGCPAYSFFQRYDELINSQIVSSINQYNQVMTMHTNLFLDVAAKYGLQSSYGWGQMNTGAGTSISEFGQKMDGCIYDASGAITRTIQYSVPLVGLLSNCERHIPLFATGPIRLALTLDSASNVFSATGAPSDFTISNVELSYNLINFPDPIVNMIKNQGMLTIKSQSFNNSATYLASGSTGNINLVYNVKYNSIKAAFISFSGTNSFNKWADAFDPTSSNGDIALSINNFRYPQRILSFKNNKSRLLQELRRACGSIMDRDNSLSINTTEFTYPSGATTTLIEPAKAIIGIRLQHSENKSAILTGVSSQNSPISVELNTATATQANHNVNLILNYDAVLKIDTINKQVVVEQ